MEDSTNPERVDDPLSRCYDMLSLFGNVHSFLQFNLVKCLIDLSFGYHGKDRKTNTADWLTTSHKR